MTCFDMRPCVCRGLRTHQLGRAPGLQFRAALETDAVASQATGSRAYERFTGMQIAKILEEERLGAEKSNAKELGEPSFSGCAKFLR